MNTESPSYHKEIWVKSIAAQVRPGQRHNPVPRVVKSIRESLFSYYITIVLTFLGGNCSPLTNEGRRREAGGSTPKEKI